MDPLRAGHVAALEGRGFHYFCNADCKRLYLSALGRPQEEEVATATPPQVAAAVHSLNSLVQPASDLGSRPTLPSREPHAPFDLSVALSVPTVAAAPSRVMRAARAVAAAPTPAPRSTGPTLAHVVRQPARGSDRATAFVDCVGIVAGVSAPAIGLLGALADARVPLVLLAWAALALRVLRTRRDPSDPHPLVVLAPAAGAVIAACWARASSDPHAAAIAVLAGMACAVAIGVETTVTRFRADVQSSRERIERALDVQARAIHGDQTVDLAASELRPGEQIVVEPGERVGVDAVVVAGDARVVPWLDSTIQVRKREGDPIVAGAQVMSRLRLTTTWSGRERAWVRLLSSASARIEVASPTARMVRHTVERGAPCAAVLIGLTAYATNAKPVQVLAAMSAGAMAFAAKGLVSLVGVHLARAHLAALSSGITYKDPRAFELAGSANVAVLSARGTVLLGEPEIVAVEPLGPERRSGDDEAARVLSLAAGAEIGSTHPFASAIFRAARMRSTPADPVRNATTHAGLGVTAVASTGERLVVGGRALMLAEKIGVAAADARVTELEAQGRSVLLVALGDRLVGLIALQDGLRTGVRAAVQWLLDARVEPVLLSGEARDTCETIGRALDIEHVRPAVLPADRGAEVRALGEGGSVVAVVGHPVSDDGALGAADVAIAMGAAGSTPGEWAVSLASDDVRDAARAIAIPHAARARVRLAIALGATPGLVALLAIGFGVAPLAVAPLAALVAAAAVAAHARETRC